MKSKHTEVIDWLESEEGEAWSKGFHQQEGNRVNNLVSVKDDNYCIQVTAAVLWYTYPAPVKEYPIVGVWFG